MERRLERCTIILTITTETEDDLILDVVALTIIAKCTDNKQPIRFSASLGLLYHHHSRSLLVFKLRRSGEISSSYGSLCVSVTEERIIKQYKLSSPPPCPFLHKSYHVVMALLA